MKKPSVPEIEDTRIDLGEDLLQTRTVTRPSASDLASTVDGALVRELHQVESSDELVVNAKILRGEGLIEEAKHTLYRSLIADPGHFPSRKLLDSIQADELKEILRGGETKRRGRHHRQKSPLDTDESPDEILRRLEADLDIGVKPSNPFRNEDDRLAFIRGVEATTQGASAENRIDLGIAFQEMGLYELARTQYEIAQRDADTERKASLLLANLQLMRGDPFQTLLLLDPLVADATRPPEDKLEVGYLMARAYEDLQRWDEATLWYRSVTQIEEDYRDSLERYQRCERIRSSHSR